jgi:phage-related baseplate assembly protein
MPIPLPKLDDRSFDQLVRDAQERARKTCPDWTDFTPGDPGTTLLELFAYLTETMLYRLNRVPPKLRIALLNLAGVNMLPPSAAAVEVVLKRQEGAPDDQPVTFPAGTQVASTDGSVIFRLIASTTIEAKAAGVMAKALNCEAVDAEPLGKTNGVAGQQFRIARAPVIRPTEDGLDFLLGVEMPQGAPIAGLAVRTVAGKTYEIWREVDNFADSAEDHPVYQLDRTAGTIQFGPAKGSNIGAGRIPAEGLEVLAWYRRGGGKAGNVAAMALTTLKDGPQGIEVSNPERATGGSDAETIEELERRAPSAISSLRVAVTARDYEQVMLNAGGIAKAHAYAQSQVWKHAEPGVVEITLMPQIDTSGLPQGAVRAENVLEHRTKALLDRAVAAINLRRPLGVKTEVKWAQVCPVSVSVKVVIGSEADPTETRQRVAERINGLLSPLRNAAFGQQLRASEVYERILSVPGVRYAENIDFKVSEVPAAGVLDLILDPAQPECWFATTKAAVYLTLDHAKSWSEVFRPKAGETRFVRRHPTRPGWAIAAVVQKTLVNSKAEYSTEIYLTKDLGETWELTRGGVDAEATDAAWIERENSSILLIATGKGLRQFDPNSGTGPSVVAVDKSIDASGCYAVVAYTSRSGVKMVAVAGRESKGVFLSASGGTPNSFVKAGLEGKDVRVLAVQEVGPRAYLWATIAAEAGAAGKGACRLDLRDNGSLDQAGFIGFEEKWEGGSCERLAFAGELVFAASNRKGVLMLNPSATISPWQLLELNCGLPLMNDVRNFEPIETVAAALIPHKTEPGKTELLVLAGGRNGVYGSDGKHKMYANVSKANHQDEVPLPARWLYCSDKHNITVELDRDGRN